MAYLAPEYPAAEHATAVTPVAAMRPQSQVGRQCQAGPTPATAVAGPGVMII
jgi:hypothetical protein